MGRLNKGWWLAAVVLMVGPSVLGLAEELPDLSGRWAMVQIYPEIATLPFAGEVRRTSTVAQWMVIEQTGLDLLMRDSYCFTDVDDGTLLVETEIPEAFIRSLRPEPRTGRLEFTDGGFLFVQDAYVEVRGAVLGNPVEDVLPTDRKDLRVIDQDEDGQPGMTVRIRVLSIIEGETYVVQRVRYSLEGALIDSAVVRGTITWSTEQSSLGASSPLLTANTRGSPDPDPTRSVFAMVRIDETWSCETLRQHLDEMVRIALGEPQGE